LRGKQALLVAPELANPLVETPEVPIVTGSENMEVDGRFDEAGTLEADFKITLLGDQAVALRSAFRQTPQPKWTELAQRISYRLGYAGDVSAVKIDNLESLDQPFLVAYHYTRKAYFLPDERDPSTGRKGLPLPPITVEAEAAVRLKKGQKLRLQGPVSLDQKVHLKFAKGQNPTAPISISLARDYGNFTSKYEVKGDELTGERSYAITVASLPAARLRDLQSFLTAVNQDRDQMLVVKLAPGAVAASAATGNDADTLNEAARARIAAKDYAGAEQLAQKAVQADPQSQDAWNTLGVAYLQQSKYEKAETAFRKQTEVNPYDEYAWNNLGRALEGLHRDEEAIAALRKQIEIVPLDKWAHKNLGWLLFNAKKYSEAAPELEKAMQINPDEAWIKIMLAQAYSSMGEKDKANAMIAKLSGSALPGASTGDYFLSAIREDGDPDAALRDAQAGLERLEQAFDFNEATDRGSSTAISVSALWGAKGWAYFRLGQMEKAERYLTAAWQMSQSAVVGSHLAEVYEKQDKKALAIQTYAQALAGEGRAPGAREKLIQLVGSARKADDLVTAARSALTVKRTTFLHKRPGRQISAELLLTFTNGEHPEKILFTGGTPSLVDRYETAMKAQKFPIAYPDETPQHIVRAAILYCGAAGCSVVLVPPSPQKALLSPLAMPGTQ
jgi:tetratricopeptide (TPR) repeat protein